MKKLSLLLVLAMIVCVFASCTPTPESLTEKADKALENDPYEVSMEFKLTCDNDQMADMFDQMADMLKIKVLIDASASDISVA